MKPQNVKLLFLGLAICFALAFGHRMRTHRNSMTADNYRLQEEIAAGLKTIEELRKSNALSLRDLKEKSQTITARLNELADQRTALSGATSTNPEPAMAAELPYRWDNASPTTRLGKRFFKALHIKPLTFDSSGDYSLNPATATIFSLTPAETENAQAAIRHMTSDYQTWERENIQQLEASTDPNFEWLNAHLTNGGTGFRVPPMPTEGSNIRDRFLLELNNAIGTSRAAMLIALGEDQFRSQLGSFGQAERWLVVQEKLHPETQYLHINVFEGTSDGHYFNIGQGIPVSMLGETREGGNAGIPVSWNHLIEGRYQTGQSLELVGGE
jgi:hypothetical protein